MIKKAYGCDLLVAGTCLGAGTLALPFATYYLGTSITIILYCFVWYIMYIASLYTGELTLHYKGNVSFVGMGEDIFGRFGKYMMLLLFFSLLFTLLLAYITAGTPILNHLLAQNHASIYGQIIMVLALFGILYAPRRILDMINRYTVILLIISFICIAYILITHGVTSKVQEGGHGFLSLIKPLPILMTAFGFQVIVPSVTHYLGKGQLFELKGILMRGSFIALLVYLIWTGVVYFTFPTQGPFSLAHIAYLGNPQTSIVAYLSSFNHTSMMGYVLETFLFMAIFSSFIGIGLSFYDLLIDALYGKLTTSHREKITVIFIIFILLSVFIYKQWFAFMGLLSFAGVIVACLNIAIPVIFVHQLHHKNSIQLKTMRQAQMYSYSSILIMIVLLVFVDAFYFI